MMSEKRFQKTRIVDKWGGIYDSKTDEVLDVNDVEHKLNEQQDQISYWKHKVSSLLWILEQFDKEKVKALMEELEEDNGGDDGVFNFNSNCAKLYQIRSVSPNGVVRVGKKNSKVSWRMKDVREISAELPPFEDFNREIFQQIKNKFHTKFDNDVIGRIIYNIYIGTFEEYI